MYVLKNQEKYLRVTFLGPCLVKKELTWPRSYKGWETLAYAVMLLLMGMVITRNM
jgi:hypothetical protein